MDNKLFLSDSPVSTTKLHHLSLSQPYLCASVLGQVSTWRTHSSLYLWNIVSALGFQRITMPSEHPPGGWRAFSFSDPQYVHY